MKKIDNADIIRMLDEGMKQSEIAAHYGVSKVAIHKRMKKIRSQEESNTQAEVIQGDVNHGEQQQMSPVSEVNTRPHNGRYFKNIKTGTVWPWTPMLEKNKDELHLRECDADGNLV